MKDRFLKASPLSRVRHDSKGGQGKGASAARAVAMLQAANRR